MRRQACSFVLFGILVLAGPLASASGPASRTFPGATPAFAEETGVREAVSNLLRPDGAPLREASGTCDIREGSAHQRFRLTVTGAGAETALRVFLGNGADAVEFIGEIRAATGPRTFLRTTLEGGELPYGADLVRTLSGRRIEIRDGEGRVVLRGEVPAFTGDGDGGGDGGGTEEPPPPAAEPLVARARFYPTEFSRETEPRGGVAITLREDSAGMRFEFGRLAPERGYLLYLGRGDDLRVADDLRTNREGGAVLEFDTRERGLPLGADSLADLAGMRVELRDGEGHVLLTGEIPALADEHDVEPVRHEEEHEDAETGTDVRIVVEIEPERGHEEMVIVVRDVPREGEDRREKRGGRGASGVEVLVDDGTGTLTDAARTRVRGGRARVRFGGRGGRLPAGADTVRDRRGRPYEIRRDGVRIAGGTLPTF